MKLNLPGNISSRQDLKSLILEVRKYARWYSQTEVKMRLTKKETYEPLAISQEAIDLINEWNSSEPISQKSLDDLIAALEKLQATVPHVVITLAAPAPGSLKKTLTSWCRENIDPNVLVDFDFNSTILGGMVLRYGSHIHDWSFRRQIMSAYDKFPEVLRRV